MLRNIIEIDEKKCTGCGLCIPNCHEGALQIIDQKARLVSDLFCDGLGACIGHCPENAIKIVKKEAPAYNEVLVMKEMKKKGKNTIIAHLNHLKEHNEEGLLEQAIAYIKENNIVLSLQNESNDNKAPVANRLNATQDVGLLQDKTPPRVACGCAGAQPIDFNTDIEKLNVVAVQNNACVDTPSQLRQWPVQLHLVNPEASYFQNADIALTADCVAFSMGNFHDKILKGKALAIACPKLDANKDAYIEKIACMIRDAKVNSLTVSIMEVPCCAALVQIAKVALEKSGKKIPIKQMLIGIKGNIIKETLLTD